MVTVSSFDSLDAGGGIWNPIFRVVVGEIGGSGVISVAACAAVTRIASPRAGEVEAAIEDIVPLERLGEAYRRLAAGEVAGKLVIDPAM